MAIAAGLMLLVIGFALVAPRGSISGSVAHRNVAMGSQFFRTPGYQRDKASSDEHRRRIVILAGLTMIAVGGSLVWFVG